MLFIIWRSEGFLKSMIELADLKEQISFKTQDANYEKFTLPENCLIVFASTKSKLYKNSRICREKVGLFGLMQEESFYYS